MSVIAIATQACYVQVRPSPSEFTQLPAGTVKLPVKVKVDMYVLCQWPPTCTGSARSVGAAGVFAVPCRASPVYVCVLMKVCVCAQSN